MKKEELKLVIERLEQEALQLRSANRQLEHRIAKMQESWRPIPIPHEWHPRDPRCVLCDDPRDAPRHHIDSAP